MQQAFAQTAPKADEFVSPSPLGYKQTSDWDLGSADMGCPFEEAVIQHLMAAAADAFASDGVLP